MGQNRVLPNPSHNAVLRENQTKIATPGPGRITADAPCYPTAAPNPTIDDAFPSNGDAYGTIAAAPSQGLLGFTQQETVWSEWKPQMTVPLEETWMPVR